MSTRTEQLAAQFAAVNDEIIATVEGCTDEQWRRPCASEGWSVGVVAHHVATVHRDMAGLIAALVAGKTLPPRISMEAVDRNNAQHARDRAAVGKPETLDALRENGRDVARVLRSLSDEHLDRPAGVFGGQELRVAQVVEWVVIDHAGQHLASIRAATQPVSAA